MAITKSKLFKADQKRSAELAKAMGHPARIAILEILAGCDSCICGDISDQLPLAQSTVSQHLKALKQAGIIKGEVDGVRTCYCLNEEGLEDMNEFLQPFIERLTDLTKKDCC